MLNSVCLIGSLEQRDEKDSRIRYLKCERIYTNFNGDVVTDIVPIVNWNKESKGEIFSFKDNSLVALRGRIETLNSTLVIVVETITYLGLKYN